MVLMVEKSLPIAGTRLAWISLVGFAVYYLAFVFLAVRGLNSGLLWWPFHPAGTLAGTWRNVAVYLPVPLIAAGSLVFLNTAGLSISEGFRWKQFSYIFYPVLAVSTGYPIYLFASTRFELHGVSFWPPILLLSLFNAFAEETAYRLVLTRLLRQLTKRTVSINFMQAAAYALPHYWIGGTRMLVAAFFYGFLLGLVADGNRSVTPAIICHFTIDIGYVGLPLLIILPS